MNPLVSVVIPTFNRREPVLQAIATVIAQTYRPVEIIVADDGSTDGTVAFLRGLEFPVPLEVVALAANRGPSAARNAGLRRARGKYVALLDSDDWWLPHKLARQVACLEQQPQPENVLVYSQVHLVRQHETLLRPTQPKGQDESMADFLFVNGGHLNSSNIILATELAQRMGYREDMRLHEDWDLYLRLEAEGVAFVMIPEVLGGSNDGERPDRASNPRPERTLSWLEIWRPRISRSAYLALRAKTAPQLRAEAPLRGLRFILEAYLRGAIDARYLLFLGGALLHPELRRLASRLRGRVGRA